MNGAAAFVPEQRPIREADFPQLSLVLPTIQQCSPRGTASNFGIPEIGGHQKAHCAAIAPGSRRIAADSREDNTSYLTRT